MSVPSFCSDLWFDNDVLAQWRKKLYLLGVSQLASLWLKVYLVRIW